MWHSVSYFFVLLKKVFYRLLIPVIYHDKNERKKHLKECITKVEKKYLRRYLHVIDSSTSGVDTKTDKIIWICWLQGEENMPPVVRKCVSSVQQHMKDYKVVILSDENIPSYVQFPPYIYERRAKKQMSPTHFSDLLRVTLLEKYGGIWIDATVYLTDRLPDQIMNADLFAYRTHSYVSSNNFLLKANAGDIIIRNMRDLLLAYWKNEPRLLDYFIYHIFFDMLIKESEVCRRIWENVPVVYDDCYELEANFFNKFDVNLWHKINSKTKVHKTSWKYKGEPKADNFLGILLAGKLED